MEMESTGVPVVAVVTKPFTTLIESALDFRKFEHVPVHTLPHPTEGLGDEELRTMADEHLPQILAKLLELSDRGR
jgi:hypothetical protein